MNCPVCKNPPGSEDADRCDSCGSDLTAYRYLSRLGRQRKRLRATGLTLGVLLLLGVGFLTPVYVEDSLSATAAMIPTSPDSSSALDEARKVLQEKDREITSLKNKVSELLASAAQTAETPEKTGPVLHIVRPGESMWSIAEKYRGDGHHYREIAAHNRLENTDHIEVGDTLTIHP